MNKSKIIIVLLAFSIFALAKNNLLAVTIKINNDTDHKVKVTAYGQVNNVLTGKIDNWTKRRTTKKHAHKNTFGIRSYQDLKTISHLGWTWKLKIKHLDSDKTYTIFETKKGFSGTQPYGRTGTWYLKITGDGKNDWKFTKKKTW
jgi:hypothetical protein